MRGVRAMVSSNSSQKQEEKKKIGKIEGKNLVVIA